MADSGQSNLFAMESKVHKFLVAVLGSDGAQALRKASAVEPALEPVLVPRAAMAWVEGRPYYEGQIPGIKNSYLRFAKSEAGYEGSISVGEVQIPFHGADVLHVAAALGVSIGVDLVNRKPLRDRALARLGKSIDALVHAQALFKSDLRSPSKLFQAKAPPKGYTLSVEQGDGGMKVHAHDSSGNAVGMAWFKHHDTGIKPVTVVVDEDHQRRGLATAMYDHARQVTGKSIVSGDIQTPEGQAFRSTYKTELPGQTHRPTQQQGPAMPTAPQKQPAMSAKPKLPKLPAMKIEKSDAERPCQDCGGAIFRDHRFVGCICYRVLAKSIRTTAYGDGYVLEFGAGIDRATLLVLQRTLRKES